MISTDINTQLKKIETELTQWDKEHYMDRDDSWVKPSVTSLIATVRLLIKQRDVLIDGASKWDEHTTPVPPSTYKFLVDVEVESTLRKAVE